jgi:hypothetical protein
MNHARPQARQIREREQAEGRPQLRLIRVREQSASASSPRQQARQQAVRDAKRATDMDNLPPVPDSEVAAAKASPLTGIGHDSGPGTNYPCHRIAVATSWLIRFPVHIHVISNNVLI